MYVRFVNHDEPGRLTIESAELIVEPSAPFAMASDAAFTAASACPYQNCITSKINIEDNAAQHRKREL